MNITLYGIPNCDTVKKARAWLDERGLAHAFHDYKKQGVPQAEMRGWMTLHGWEKLLNRRGPTWRKLDPARQAAVTDAASANQTGCLVAKRPIELMFRLRLYPERLSRARRGVNDRSRPLTGFRDASGPAGPCPPNVVANRRAKRGEADCSASC